MSGKVHKGSGMLGNLYRTARTNKKGERALDKARKAGVSEDALQEAQTLVKDKNGDYYEAGVKYLKNLKKIADKERASLGGEAGKDGYSGLSKINEGKLNQIEASLQKVKSENESVEKDVRKLQEQNKKLEETLNNLNSKSKK